MRQRDWLLLGAAAGAVYVLSRRGGVSTPPAGPVYNTPRTAVGASDPWAGVIGQIVGRIIAQPQQTQVAYDPIIGLPIEPSAPAFQDYWDVTYYPPESIGYR